MKTIPTAEEFFDSPNLGVSFNSEYQYCQKRVIELAKEFAKLHVEAALKEASEKADAKADKSYSLRVSRKNLFWMYGGNIGDVEIDKDSILNAYPLSKIV